MGNCLIYDFLRGIGMRPAHSGFMYWEYALEAAVYTNGKITMRNIYDAVSKKTGSPLRQIEGDMWYAIVKTYECCDKEQYERLCDICMPRIDSGHATVKEFLSCATRKIKQML